MPQIGDVLEIPSLTLDDYGHVKSDKLDVKTWTIIKDYKNFVLCQCGNEKQCFTHNELIQLGYEKQADKYEAMRDVRERHWSAGKSVDNYKRKYEDEEEWE